MPLSSPISRSADIRKECCMASKECGRRRKGASGGLLHSPLNTTKTPRAPGRLDHSSFKPRPHQRVDQHDADSFTTPLPHLLRVVTEQYVGCCHCDRQCCSTFFNKSLKVRH